ncbi:ThiF family adenylyltransferase [Actinomyces qiguomingii]|uniref:ThiF family adenylyltransferase n=1 Tax=Actinomyces qiguomingii TaxID=2057800 RepID=UPI000CA06826|nr:ThiF family adenylyltransferase [Actinomyces qiguomingii]
MASYQRPIIKRSLPVYRVDAERFRIGAQLGITAQFTDPKNQMWDLVSNLDGREMKLVIESTLAQHPELTEGDVKAGLDMLDQRGFLDEGYRPDDKIPARYRPNVEYFAAVPGNSTNNAEQYQRNIMASHVLLLGGGGGGSNIATLLAGVGFGEMTIVDYDVVEESNLGRQFLYRSDELGNSKVQSAKKAIEAMNPYIAVHAVDKMISSAEDLTGVMKGADIVICALDEPPFLAQRRVNKAIVDADLPCVFGATQVTHGRVFTVVPKKTGCFDCLHLYYSKNDPLFDSQFKGFHNAEFAPPTIAYGPAIWNVALTMVDEAVRVLTGYTEPMTLGRQYELDYLSYSAFSHDPWPKDSECPTCGDGEYGRWPALSQYQV